MSETNDSVRVSVPDQIPAKELISGHLTIDLAGMQIETDVVLPKGPTSVGEMLPFFRALCQAIVQIAEQSAKAENVPISCKAGCGACCRMLVHIPEPDAHAIRHLVDNLPEPRQTEIRRRFAAAIEQFIAIGLIDKLRRLNQFSHEEQGPICQEYFLQRIPCPFLENESCSIYLDRPTTCREYLVLSDPKLCADPSQGVVARVGLLGRVSLALAQTTEGRGPAAGIGRWVPLILALEWSASHPEEPPILTGPQVLEEVLGNLQQTQPDIPQTPSQPS